MSEHRCVCCPVLRSDGEPRQWTTPHVCDGCRSRLDATLADIPAIHDALPLEPVVSERGTRTSHAEPAIPPNLDALDLTMPARVGQLSADAEPPTGYLSAATVLESWARDWQSVLWPDSVLPNPTVVDLARWQRDRLPVACQRHPAIDEYAREISDLARVMRRVAGLTPAPVDVKHGVPCRQCGHLSLYQAVPRQAVSGRPVPEYIECGMCPALLTIEEYHAWTQLIAGSIMTMKRRRVPA